ncbi:hypothetical protein PIB30_000203 [Stylosanthes scabra]|uniref:Uncharacterized protein n=1 Tax=Stylosanthes scabra TaxID=79078 RepID=A0ABU6S280_9FABA|nr:hypothetical protein [Stylosanthes scabra]
MATSCRRRVGGGAGAEMSRRERRRWRVTVEGLMVRIRGSADRIRGCQPQIRYPIGSRIGYADANHKSAIRSYSLADWIGSDVYADQIRPTFFGLDCGFHRGYADPIRSLHSPTWE